MPLLADYNRRFGLVKRLDMTLTCIVQSVPPGDGPSRRRPREEGKKSQRSLNNDDMLEALKQLQSQSEEIFGKRARTGR